MPTLTSGGTSTKSERDIYSHVMPSLRQEAADAMDRVLVGAAQ
jgi:hypothetical protein